MKGTAHRLSSQGTIDNFFEKISEEVPKEEDDLVMLD